MADQHPELVEPVQPVIHHVQAGQVDLGQVLGGKAVEPGVELGKVAVLDQGERIALVDAVIEQQRQRVLDAVDRMHAFAPGEFLERGDRAVQLFELQLQRSKLRFLAIAPAHREQRLEAVVDPGPGRIRGQACWFGHRLGHGFSQVSRSLIAAIHVSIIAGRSVSDVLRTARAPASRGCSSWY